MLQFKCACGHQLKVSDDLAGWQTQCPKCRQLIPVPSAEPEPAPVAERAPVNIPWKIIAICSASVAVIAIIVAIASGGEPSPQEEEAQVKRLKRQIADLERDLAAAQADRASSEDTAKLTERAKQAEAERDRVRRQYEEAVRQLEAARKSGGASSKPAEPQSAPAANADPAKPAEGSINETEADMLDRCARSVVQVRSDRGVGGGFFVSADGYTVTSYRIVAGSLARKVIYISGKGPDRVRMEAEADVIAVDRRNDLALLKVNVSKLVTFAGLETGWGISVGQELLMWEPPPGGTNLLDHTLTKGGAVDLEYIVEGFKYIQTMIPISPSNYGVPLWNKMGKVIGMTVLKGEASNVAATVIPVAFVAELINNRETTFSVGRNFAEWETTMPAGALVSLRPTDIKVEGVITKMILDEENDRIVGLDVEKNGVCVVSLSKKKLLRSIPTGTDPMELQQSGTNSFWVSHTGARNIVKVNVEEGRVYDRVDVGGNFRRFAASRSHIWAYGGPDHSFLIHQGTKKVTTMLDRFYGLSYDRRRDRLIGIYSTVDRSGMCEIEPDRVASLIKDIADIKAEGHKGDRYKELPDLQQELNERLKFWPAPTDSSTWFSGGAYTIVIDPAAPVIYVNRSVLKAKQMDQIVATFKPVNFMAVNTPGVFEAHRRFEHLDRIQSGSPNGKWVATGSHIYSTETFSMHKELPILTPTSAFSSDSKTLWIYDLSRRAIVPVDVESKPAAK